ncbi:MAG: glycoside hydrolase family 13 protein, partial [Planctomycetota bacterium]
PIAEDADPSIVHLVPLHAGDIELEIQVKADDEWSEPQRLTLNVRNRVFVQGPHRSADDMVANRLELHPTEDGRWVTVLRAAKAGPQELQLRDLDRDRTLEFAFDARERGEMFAVAYRPDPMGIETTPGLYRLIEGPSTYRLDEQSMPIPASGVLHDPRRPDHAASISSGLGLVDLKAWTAADTTARLNVRVLRESRERPEQSETVTVVPMVPTLDEDTSRLEWSARIKTEALPDGAAISGSETAGPMVKYELVKGGPQEPLRRVAGPFSVEIDPEFETPDWAKQAVWYQIFPERFRNGNPANDPHGDFVFPLPWNSDWHTLHDGEFEAWRSRVIAAGGNPDRWDREITGEPGGRFYNVVWDRRYGGDLQGVMQSLDYLKELGVTALYLNPIFEGESLHKYDTSDFRHVDDNFGNAGQPPADWSAPAPEDLLDPSGWTWTEADRYFLNLIQEVHDRDMKIIIDGVFNHVGREHPAFAHVMEHGEDSPFADWFMCEFDDEGNLVGWVAWDEPNGWLPKFNQKENRDLVDPVKKHIFDITRRWMDPNGDGDPSDGIDGWRLDVPLDVGIPFWIDWYHLVKSINPEAYISAEIWTEWESEPHLRGDRFDAQMHYPVARETINWLVMEPGMTSDEFADRLEGIYARFEPQTELVQQNLFASHDTERVVSNLYNDIPGRYFDSGNRPQQGEPFKEDRPDERAYAMSRLALAMQATYVGTPMIYYGQEIGMHGADDPSCRKPRPWPDTPAPVNAEDRPDYELESFYREWLNMRANDVVLQLGSVEHLSSGRDDVFAFVRQLNGEARLVVINRGIRRYPLERLVSGGAAGDRVVGPLDAVVVPVDPADILW